MTQAVAVDHDVMEQAYLEYRRACYHILYRHAERRGVIDLLRERRTVAELASAMEILPSGAKTLRRFLGALVRFGAVEKDDAGYRAIPDGIADATTFDAELIQLATGRNDIHDLIHADSYAGVVDGLYTAANPVATSFTNDHLDLWDEFLQAPFYAYHRERAAHAVGSPGATVLDLAAGLGYGSRELLSVVGDTGEVLAVEVSKDFIGAMAGRTTELTNLHLLQANLDGGLPYLRDAAFDGAILVGAYHFLGDPESLFRDVARVMRPGARFCLAYVFSAFDSYDRELMELRMSLREPVARCVPAGEIQALAESNGLRETESFSIGCFGWHLLTRD